MTYANGISSFYHYYDKGPFVSGVNITPFLVNGKNSLPVEVAGLGGLEGDETYPIDAKYELWITTATLQGETEIARVIATENEKKQPTGLNSSDYTGKNSGFPVMGNSIESYITYKITRDFTIRDIPDWTWIKATPFEPSVENMAKLRRAYTDLRQLILNKDGAGIRRMAQMAFSEKEMVEGLRSGAWYVSLDFDYFPPQFTTVEPIKWEDFE